MKTRFAQVATFALSAAGALAIIVGVIDQPQVALGATGLPVGAPGAAAAASPAVGPMA